MAASEPPPDEQPPPQNPPLPYKTWVLKVSIHCQACKRKVKKVLQSIEGVYITDIDEKQHKVTVTGNVEADALIKKLIRSGKNAEMWHEKPSFKEKKSGNPKNNDQKQDGSKSNENSDDDDDDEEDKPGENADGQKQGSQKSGRPSVRFDVPPPGNAPAGAPAGQGPKKKKKKKKKKSNSAGNAAPAGSNNAPPGNAGPEASKMGPPPHGVDQGNLSHPYPPPPHTHQYPPSYAPQQAYVVSYNAAPHPAASGAPTYYYAPSSPYTYAYTRAEVHSMRCRPLDSFEILSDENPNACYIM